MTKIKLRKTIFVLSLIVSSLPEPARPQEAASVSVIANIGGVSDVDRSVFSPDNRLLATLDGFYGRNARLWDVNKGRLLRKLDNKAYVDALVFSPDGHWIISGLKNGEIELRDLRSDALARAQLQAPGHGDDLAVSSLWVDPSSAFLVAGNDKGVITVWNVNARKPIDRYEFGKIPDPTAIPRVVAAKLNADRSRLIALTRTSIRVFDVKTGKIRSSFDLPNNYSTADRDDYYFSRDSIVGDDGFVVRLTSPSCKIDQVLFVQLDNAKTFHEVDKPASCDESKEDDNSVRSFGEPEVFSSSDGSSLILTRWGTPEVKQWSKQTFQVQRTIAWSDKSSARIIGISPDLKLAATIDDGKIGIRQLENGASVSEVAALRFPAEPAENVVAAADGKSILISHEDKDAQTARKSLTICRVDEAGPKTVRLTADKDTLVYDFALAPMLAAAAAREKGEAILYSLESGHERNRFSIPGVKTISSVRLSPDGNVLVVIGADADDKAVAMLVGTADGAVKIRFSGRDQPDRMAASLGRDDPSDLVTVAAFSADSKMLAVGRWNGTAEVWNVETLKRMTELPADPAKGDQTWSLAFSDDGQRLVGGSRNSGVFLWDISTRRLVRTFDYDDYLAGHAHFASVALSHDKKTIVAGLAMHAISSGDSGPEHGIKVWDVATGKLLLTLRGHQGGVGALAFSANDRWIVSGSFDGTLRYWDRATGKLMATHVAATDGRWLIVTESGIFNGTPGSDHFIEIVQGLQSRPASEFRQQLDRPDLVEQLLAGDSKGLYYSAAHQLHLEKLLRERLKP